MAPRRAKSFLLLACLLFVLALPLTVGAACTLTTWASFCKQARGDLNWDLELNGNFDKMDRFLNGVSESLIRVKAYTVATLPVASTTGRLARLTDGGCAGVLIQDDGTKWRALMETEQALVNPACPPYNATANGSSDDRAALDTANTAAGLTGTLIFPRGTYRVASALTLSATARFENGAVLAPDTSIVITITGDVQAGASRIFSVGSGTISFAGNTRISRLNPKWWGASASLLTTTVTCTSGLPTVTLAAAQDFTNGQAVWLYGCAVNKRVMTSVIVSGGGTTSLTLADAATNTNAGFTFGHDDSYAVSAAVDAANTVTHASGVAVPTGMVVAFDPGEYPICGKPVLMNTARVELVGASRANSALRLVSNPTCPAASGLWLAVVPGDAPGYMAENPFTGTALLTGTGNAMQLIGKVDRYLQLSDCPFCGDLNGLAQFTAEATINLTSIPATAMILSSSGTRDSVDGDKRLFDMFVATNGALTCRLNVAGTLRTVAGGAGNVTAGVTTHVALSYDGSNLRCFAAGTQVASAFATSGTITQARHEQVRIGPDTRNFPEGVGFTAGFNGRLDAPRLSSTGRYTSNFTAPTAKWGAADTSTVVQCNFSTQTGIWTTCDSGLASYAGISFPGPALLPFHKSETCSGGTATALRNLQLYGGGVYLNGGPSFDVENVWVNTTISNGHGIIQGSQCGYDAKFKNIRLDAGNPSRVLLASDSGITTIENLTLGGSGDSPHPIILPANSTLKGQNFITGAGASLVFPVIFRGLGAATIEGNKPFVEIFGINTDVETTIPATKALILIDDIEQTTLSGSQLGCGGNTGCFALQVQKGGNLTIQSSALGGGASTAQIHVTGSPNPTGKVLIIGSQNAGAKPPRWTDLDGLEIVFSSRLSTVSGANDPSLFDLNTMAQATQLPNAGSTGTFRTTLTKLTNAAAAIVSAAGDTSAVVGIAGAGTGTTGRSQIQVVGQATCTFDAATTAGNFVQISATQAGACADAGAALPGANQVIGRVLATAALIAAPSAGAATTCSTTGGTIADGTYQVSNTWVTMTGGETTQNNRRTSVCTGGGTSSFTAGVQPTEVSSGTTPAGAAGWRIYVSAAGGGAGSETLQPIANYCASANRVTIANGTQICTTSALMTANTGAGAALPGANTAGPGVSVLLGLGQR